MLVRAREYHRPGVLPDGDPYGAISFYMQATSGKRVHHGEIHQMDATSNGYVDGGLGALVADTASHGFIMVSEIQGASLIT